MAEFNEKAVWSRAGSRGVSMRHGPVRERGGYRASTYDATMSLRLEAQRRRAKKRAVIALAIKASFVVLMLLLTGVTYYLATHNLQVH